MQNAAVLSVQDAMLLNVQLQRCCICNISCIVGEPETLDWVAFTRPAMQKPGKPGKPIDLRGAGAIEGVGLQDVSSSLQELIVDVRDDIRAGDDQQIIVAPQLVGVVPVALSSKILLCQPASQTTVMQAKGRLQWDPLMLMSAATHMSDARI